jgi:hypothetical protein
MSYAGKIAAALAAATAVVALVSAATAHTIELKVSHSLPPNHTFQKNSVAWRPRFSRSFATTTSWEMMGPALVYTEPQSRSSSFKGLAKRLK